MFKYKRYYKNKGVFTMNTEKKNYFKDVAKKGYLIAALLLAMLAITGIVASYEFGLYGVVQATSHIMVFVTVVLAIVGLAILAFLIIGLKLKNPSIADAFYLAIVAFGIGFLLFVAIELKEFNLRRVLFAVIVLVVGAVLLTLRIASYEKANSEGKLKGSNNVIKSYYSELINNYSFLSIIIIAGVSICAAYILFNKSIGVQLKYSEFYAVAIICIIPFFIYAIKAAFSKTVNVLDAFLLSGVVSFPVLFVQIFVTSYSPLRAILWGSALIVYLALTFIRYISYKPNALPAKFKATDGNYFKTLFAKYDILLAIAIASVTALAGLIMLRTRAIQTYFFDANSAINIVVRAIPYAVTLVASLVPLAFFALTALLSICKKSVGIGDFFLLICFCFVIFGFVLLIAHPSPWMIYLNSAFCLYTVVLTFIRSKIVNKK